MTERDVFERALETRLLTHVERAVRPFDPVRIARDSLRREDTLAAAPVWGRLLPVRSRRGWWALVLVTALIALLLTAGVIVGGPPTATPIPADRGAFAPAGSLHEARTVPRSTLLADGSVAVIGGFGAAGSLASIERWDSTTQGFTPAGQMAVGRADHTATRLPDGTVLIIGGENGSPETRVAETWDPKDGTVEPAGTLAVERSGHTATLLGDGRVLVVGGCVEASCDGAGASAETWDPVSRMFSAAGSLAQARSSHTSTLLDDGRVLVTGGWGISSIDDGSTMPVLASAEIWDPVTGTFSPTGSMARSRRGHTATLLDDGRVLVVGGMDESEDLVDAEIWDPLTGQFDVTRERLVQRRVNHTATLLADGRVLIAGGDGPDPLAAAEIWDPATELFEATGPLADARSAHSATLLDDGRVLVVGGWPYVPQGAAGSRPRQVASAELFELR